MKLNILAVPKDAHVSQPKKKVPTEFERKRAACRTYDELVELGYAEGMEFPEGWAEHVMYQRNNS